MKKTKEEIEAQEEILRQLNEQVFLTSFLWEGGKISFDTGNMFTEDMGQLYRLKERYASKESKATEYWEKQDNWSLLNLGMDERWKKQKEMLEDGFVPYLNKSQKICDLACAIGEWSLLIADYAGTVDGFDCSEQMIEMAKKNALQAGIDNVCFRQADANQLELDTLYDNFMLLGLLTYVEKEEDAVRILKNIANHITPKARLITKDTLNIAEEQVVYIYNKYTGYQATYWSQEKYYSFFKQAGFSLEKEYLLENPVYYDGVVPIISRGAVWIKDCV